MMYRRDGLIFMGLKDRHWSDPKVAKILPYESTNWGAFADLKGTDVERLIPEVSAESLDRAMRGDCTPLMNEGLREPRGCLKLLNAPKDCDEKDHCLSYKKDACILGHRKMPDCFSPLTTQSLRPLVIAWLEGFYIVRERRH
tara:strand:+ start:114 stop:539 length:426 start_codon:yes stop_codon:yes gene_type:complete